MQASESAWSKAKQSDFSHVRRGIFAVAELAQ